MAAREMAASPRTLARIGGVLYLTIIVIGVLAEALVRDALVVAGDPAATAENIRQSETLWRAGIAGNLFHLSLSIVLAVIFYVLLQRVSRDLALLATLLNVAAITLEAASKLGLATALFLLGDSDYLVAFESQQLQTLAYLSIRAHGYGFGVSLIFFGFFCIVIGYLIFRSGFWPRTLGVLMAIAGLSYLVNSFALVLSPRIADLLFPTILLPAFVAETSLSLWMILKGVDVEHLRAEEARTRS